MYIIKLIYIPSARESFETFGSVQTFETEGVPSSETKTKSDQYFRLQVSLDVLSGKVCEEVLEIRL